MLLSFMLSELLKAFSGTSKHEIYHFQDDIHNTVNKKGDRTITGSDPAACEPTL